ncbi:MAG: hypothetical protein E6G33_11525 [Actinobacteria bacterium]|nr:MAG: hypothetical protein E6G33_11525 [Actinomycetota bacterium]
MRSIAVLVMATALSFAGTGSATVSSGLRGVVMRGPVMPVCMVGQPCDEPAANLKLIFVRDRIVAGRARTDAQGRYRVVLRPGRYSVRIPGKVLIGRGIAPPTVRVLRGRFLRVDFFVDTGIR